MADDSGFTFIEHRHTHLDAEGLEEAEQAKERLRQEAERDKAKLEAAKEKQKAKAVVFGEVDVISLFETLASTALAQMGLLQDPNHPVPRDLRGARNSIDLLRVVKAKTEGNLTAEEQRVIDELLYTLQMNFVQASKPQGPPPPPPPHP